MNYKLFLFYLISFLLGQLLAQITPLSTTEFREKHLKHNPLLCVCRRWKMGQYSQPAEQGHVLTETRVGQPHQGRVHHRSAIKHKNYHQLPKMATQPRCADCHSKSLEDLYCRSQTNPLQHFKVRLNQFQRETNKGFLPDYLCAIRQQVFCFTSIISRKLSLN